MQKLAVDELFLLGIVENLVEFPAQIELVRSTNDKGVLLELTVAPSDVGRVIGKGGVIAQSIRTLLHALGMSHAARYTLKIIDGKRSTK